MCLVDGGHKTDGAAAPSCAGANEASAAACHKVEVGPWDHLRPSCETTDNVSFSRQSTAASLAGGASSSASSSGSEDSPRRVVQTPSESQTTVVLDWDDTLLCTSFLNLHEEAGAEHPAVVAHLRAIERAAVELLERSLQIGQTSIITNAVEGWVEHSAALYIPGILPLLKRVKIVSARNQFEELFPLEPGRWKSEAFLDIQQSLDPERTTNIISIGDSPLEMDAAQELGLALDAAFAARGRSARAALVKTVKFRERPTPEELRKQLELVIQKFERIVESPKGLKIVLERKWVSAAPTAET